MSMLRIKKDSDIQLTDHFNSTRDKFDCQCRSVYCTHTLVYKPTLTFIEEMRVGLGYQMTFNCGYRCPVHNEAVGGGKYSQHMWGLAVDIRPIDNSQDKLDEMYKFAMGALTNSGGISKYNTFLHIDLREKRARW